MSLHFLFTKHWHPATFQNQKKVWIAEQKEVEREKREREAAAELKREQEHFQNAQLAAQMGDTEAQRLVAAGDVMFMYAAPGGPKGATQAGATAPPRNTEEESEDEAVRRFKAEVLGIAPPEVAQEASGAAPDASSQAAGSGTGATAARRRQRSGGKGGSDDDSGEDDAAGRPAFLKHAPVEGEFARGTKTLKPFNQVVRDIQCIRCGQWGHRSVDRECPMRDMSRNDLARQQREDPATVMAAIKQLRQGEMAGGIRLKPSAMPTGIEPIGDAHTAAGRSYEEQYPILLDSGDELLEAHAPAPARARGGGHDEGRRRARGKPGRSDSEGSDAEREYLASLSREQKEQLLQQLMGMPDAGGKRERHKDRKHGRKERRRERRSRSRSRSRGRRRRSRSRSHERGRR